MTGKDRAGRKFKTLLSRHAKAADQSLETALGIRGCSSSEFVPPDPVSTRLPRPGGQTLLKPLCKIYAEYILRGGEPANEDVFKVLMNFWPIIKLHWYPSSNPANFLAIQL